MAEKPSDMRGGGRHALAPPRGVGRLPPGPCLGVLLPRSVGSRALQSRLPGELGARRCSHGAVVSPWLLVRRNESLVHGGGRRCCAERQGQAAVVVVRLLQQAVVGPSQRSRRRGISGAPPRLQPELGVRFLAQAPRVGSQAGAALGRSVRRGRPRVVEGNAQGASLLAAPPALCETGAEATGADGRALVPQDLGRLARAAER
mmetsp:Transcript_96033/g.277314  ORF Transcript_96033/g.277314 Transcript_96033/m.277314 type:complete len:203 (-) Transcript_96033:80-688(-)